MVKKAALILSLLILTAISVSPVQAESRSDIAVELTESAVTSFPDKIEFYLDIETGIRISDVRLHYFVERKSFSDVTQEIIVAVPLPFQPEMSLSWTWDMRTTGSMPREP